MKLTNDLSLDSLHGPIVPAGSTLSDGLINYWALESAASLVDSVGSYTVAVPYGGASGTGLHNNCLVGTNNFDGGYGDSAGPGPSYSLPPNFSVSFWIKQAADGSGQTMIPLSVEDDNTRVEFFVDVEFSVDRLQVYMNDYADSWRPSIASLTSTNWNHLAFTYNGTTLSLYLNGSFSASNPMTLVTNAANFIVSLGLSKGNNGLVRSQDETAIWNRALTAPEVAELYNAGAGKFYPF